MCGITGWASFHSDARTRAPVIEAMTAALAPRGPDAGGVWLGERVAIGHRRLAVIDLTGGFQPMTDRSDTPTAVLSYSGEVYNHHELRAELRQLGHTFRTRSDTEVVLRGYAEWGEELVDHLDGMFAFAVEDTADFTGTRSALQRECRKRACGVIQRSRAWGDLIAEHHPRSVRLSIHPQPIGTPKFGIRLLDAPNAWTTPWAQDAGPTTMESRVLSTMASNSDRSCCGTSNLSSVCLKSSMKASHSSPVISMSRWESFIARPVYRCGPPVASPTISVTRYLNPGGNTRWCASSTRGFAFSRSSTMIRSMKSSTTVAML